MTLVPSLLVTGTWTILASLAVLLWAVTFVDGPHGGRGLVLLSVVMLLVGGGFGPPCSACSRVSPPEERMLRGSGGQVRSRDAPAA